MVEVVPAEPPSENATLPGDRSNFAAQSEFYVNRGSAYRVFGVLSATQNQ